MRCPNCAARVHVESKFGCTKESRIDVRWSCSMPNGAKYGVRVEHQEPFIGVVEWVGNCDDGNTSRFGIAIEGKTYHYKNKHGESWERYIFNLTRHVYRYDMDWLKVGTTVCLIHVTNCFGYKEWHATLVVDEKTIQEAKLEMRLALIQKYQRLKAKAEERLQRYNEKLQDLFL